MRAEYGGAMALLLAALTSCTTITEELPTRPSEVPAHSPAHPRAWPAADARSGTGTHPQA
jgi:hypothetical protein